LLHSEIALNVPANRQANLSSLFGHNHRNRITCLAGDLGQSRAWVAIGRRLIALISLRP
jgi:hypothetical protein